MTKGASPSQRLAREMSRLLTERGVAHQLVERDGDGFELWAEQDVPPPAPGAYDSGTTRVSVRHAVSGEAAAGIAKVDNVSGSARYRVAEMIEQLARYASEAHIELPPDSD